MLKNLISKIGGKNNIDRVAFSLLTTFLVIVALFIAAGMLFPTTVAIILNVVWITLIALVVIFFVLGFLVIFGMRKEVSKFLDILLEGSLSFIEFLNLVKNLWKQFVALVKEFLVYAAPVFAYIAAFLIYILLLVIYKSVGKTSDVTLLTILLSSFMLIIFGVLSRPKPEVEALTWKAKFGKRFQQGLIDGLEVLLFVFFLTMDSTKLIFLPADLNIPLHARVDDYDLMERSFMFKDHLRITLNLIMATILIEIVRNILRIFALARKHYLELSVNQADNQSIMTIIKSSIRKSFVEYKDDIMKFITFNTILFLVFLLFPRLKLVTLLVASITNLLLDIIIIKRLTSHKGSDLISRGLAKIVKV